MNAALLDGATAAEAISRLASVTTSPAGATSGFRQAARAVQARPSNPGVVTRTARHPAGGVLCCDLAGHAMAEWGPVNLEDVRLVVLGDPRGVHLTGSDGGQDVGPPGPCSC